MHLRKADKNDIEQLIVLRLEFLQEQGKCNPPKNLEEIILHLREYLQTHLNNDCFMYIYQENQQIVSSAMLICSEKPANLDNPSGKSWILLNVYTRPEYRRRGLAERLIRRVLEDAEKMKLDFMELKATKDGYPLYKKLEFYEEESLYTTMRYTWKK